MNKFLLVLMSILFCVSVAGAEMSAKVKNEIDKHCTLEGYKCKNKQYDAYKKLEDLCNKHQIPGSDPEKDDIYAGCAIKSFSFFKGTINYFNFYNCLDNELKEYEKFKARK